MDINKTEYKRFMTSLENWHKLYDSTENMIKVPFSSPGYHTTLKGGDVHTTRDSLIYALALLDSEIVDYREIACKILEKVISLQDCDRSHNTFGIWSWFFEEPLEKMSPPDWNWADFCGKMLLLAAIRHQENLPNFLNLKLKQAVFNACDAIIKRNVGPDYTNIAIMGAFVTLLAGEFYNSPMYLDYGLERLENFSKYTKRLGVFEEYNSPTYTVVAIIELSSIHTETHNEKAKRLSAELLDIAWRTVAEHFHTATGQWGGPHQRSYNSLLTKEVLSFIQLATKDKLTLLEEEYIQYSIEWYKKGIQCPQKYISSFVEPVTNVIQETFHNNEKTGLIKTGTTFCTSEYSFGTVNKEVMWNQRRNLIAYLSNNGKTTYAHLRFLHDGYDYSSAVFTCAQNRGNAIFGFNFATDGGDTHISLDRINGSIYASDLRVRFELGGCLEEMQTMIKSEDGENIGVCAKIAGLTLTAKTIYAKFQNEKIQWEINKEDEKIYLDCVVYSGERKIFNFIEISCAALAFSFSISEVECIYETEITEEEDRIMATLNNSEGQLKISLELKPEETEHLLLKNNSVYIDTLKMML